MSSAVEIPDGVFGGQASARPSSSRHANQPTLLSLAAVVDEQSRAEIPRLI